ncbi:hypothetical protein Ac2012v2_003703 [Leucoagaricus gongylophorus]
MDWTDPFMFLRLEGTVPKVSIEFCDRCRWLHRATWIQTELFLTFPPPIIASITLLPRNAEDTAGIFRVWLTTRDEQKLVWDRKTEGGFPELKVLKQRIRDAIQPGRSLGHSDNHNRMNYHSISAEDHIIM